MDAVFKRDSNEEKSTKQYVIENYTIAHLKINESSQLQVAINSDFPTKLKEQKKTEKKVVKSKSRAFIQVLNSVKEWNLMNTLTQAPRRINFR